MILRIVINLSLFSSLISCALGSKDQRRFANEADDFSLSDSDGSPKVDDKVYFRDLQQSESAVGFESSFPLPFAVGKSIDRFDRVPEQAKFNPPAFLSVQLAECQFFLKTTTVQVDRYILAGQWIKLSEGLPSSVPVKLEPHMDLNVKVVAKLNIIIPPANQLVCKHLMEGRKIPLGRFHLNRSKIGLLSGPGFPRAVFSSRYTESKGKPVFVRWQVGGASPILIDDLDFPATSESGIFRSIMSEKGYYYLIFIPALRLDQIEHVAIRIPLQPVQSQKSDIHENRLPQAK